MAKLLAKFLFLGIVRSSRWRLEVKVETKLWSLKSSSQCLGIVALWVAWIWTWSHILGFSLFRCSNFDLLSLQSGPGASQVLWLQIRLWPGLRFGLGLVSWACQVLKVAWTEVSCSSVGRRPRQQSVGHDQQARSLSVNRTQGPQQASGVNVKKVRSILKDIGHKH